LAKTYGGISDLNTPHQYDGKPFTAKSLTVPSILCAKARGSQ
jgi:hypothetical protein